MVVLGGIGRIFMDAGLDDDEMMRGRKSITTEGSEDLMSSLPDSMASHILSFLSIKDILRTSAVSRSWRWMWTKTPTISYTFAPEESSQSFKFAAMCSSLNRLYTICPPPSVRQLCLRMHYYDFDFNRRFDQLLFSAIAHQLQDLTLFAGCRLFIRRPGYILPEFLFEHSSMVSLRLHSCEFTLCHGGSCRVNWIALKVLRVGGVEFTDDVIDTVLKGTPALEYLELVDCWGMKHIRLSSTKIRELVIHGYSYPSIFGVAPDDSDDDDDDDDSDSCMLQVSAPHLISLQMLGFWCGKGVLRLHQVSSLVEVKLDFVFQRYAYLDKKDGFQMLRWILNKLSHVNTLVLGNKVLMALHIMILKTMVPLHLNCRKLILPDFDDPLGLLGLTYLFHCTWKIEKLVINSSKNPPPATRVYRKYVSTCEKHSRHLRWKTLECLAKHLDSIEISGIQALPQSKARCQILLMGALLRNALVLKEMVINAKTTCTGDDGEESLSVDYASELLKMKQEIQSIPRGARDSKLIFNFYPSRSS